MPLRARRSPRTPKPISLPQLVAWSVALLLFLAARPAATEPEDPGEFTFEVWSAGVVSAAGARIPTRVYHPTGPAESRPFVFVMHGWARLGHHWRVLGETLASRGYVAIVPDMPCSLGSCDHAANAEQISALLTWAIEQSESDTPIAGRVDPERIGAIGHSWGALAVLLAAADDDRIDSVVLIDPNDDGGVSLPALDDVHVPTATLFAQRLGSCNSDWRRDLNVAADVRLQLVVPGAAHCDPEDPSDLVCPIACGSGDPSLAWVFRRYAVAWTVCALSDDDAVAPYVGGDALADDESAERVDDIRANGLDGLRCRGGETIPGDVGGEEIGVTDGDVEEVGVTDDVDDGGRSDGGAVEPADAGLDPSPTDTTSDPAAPDAAASPPGEQGGKSGSRRGCAMTTGGATIPWLALALFAVRRSRRR